jgi:hypothetical protein
MKTLFSLLSFLLVVACDGFLPSFYTERTTTTTSRVTQRQMFTGIVEEMGTVVSLEERDDMPMWDGTKGKGTELVVKGNVVMDDAYLG